MLARVHGRALRTEPSAATLSTMGHERPSMLGARASRPSSPHAARTNRAQPATAGRYGLVTAWQRSIGNHATVDVLGNSGAPGALIAQRDGLHAPKESPALTPETVKRAERMKRSADKVELDLKVAVRDLSQAATPVIKDFGANYQFAYKRVVALVDPFLPSADTMVGSMVGVTLGFATYFLPQARGLRAIGAALVQAVGSEGLEHLAGEAAEANRKAERALQLSQWLSETKVVGDAAYRAGEVVPSQYDAAIDLMIAVGRPWVAKLDAQDTKDRRAEILAAASYVAAADAFLTRAPEAAKHMRALTASYRAAARDNRAQQEVVRVVALVTPSVLAKRIPSWFGLQSDRRPEFVREVLVPLLPGLSPAQTAKPLSYVRTVRALINNWFELVSSRGAPVATIHYAGHTIEMTASSYKAINRLQQLVEAEQGNSLPSADDQARSTADGSWIDEVQVGINTYRTATQWALMEQARTVVAAETEAAHHFWNRMAGVP